MNDRSERFAELDEPQRRGDAAEAILRAAFATRGVTVLRPDHDNAPYDLVIDLAGTFYRIQVKTAYETRNDGSVQFETRSTRVKSDGYERETYDDDVDYFGVYDPINDSIYLVSAEEVPNSSMFVRYESAANGNTANVNWYEDYLLDSVLGDLEDHPVG